MNHRVLRFSITEPIQTLVMPKESKLLGIGHFEKLVHIYALCPFGVGNENRTFFTVPSGKFFNIENKVFIGFAELDRALTLHVFEMLPNIKYPDPCLTVGG